MLNKERFGGPIFFLRIEDTVMKKLNYTNKVK